VRPRAFAPAALLARGVEQAVEVLAGDVQPVPVVAVVDVDPQPFEQGAVLRAEVGQPALGLLVEAVGVEFLVVDLFRRAPQLLPAHPRDRAVVALLGVDLHVARARVVDPEPEHFGHGFPFRSRRGR
jgi:hypothetical protein